MRADSVTFPPGGCAYLHTHQGPGIRCLIEGGIRIDMEGASTCFAPGGAWFESGPAPVFAQAAQDRATRFIRVMILPAELKGRSSIAYVNAEDHDKPKSQRYKGYLDETITLSVRMPACSRPQPRHLGSATRAAAPAALIALTGHGDDFEASLLRVTYVASEQQILTTTLKSTGLPSRFTATREGLHHHQRVLSMPMTLSGQPRRWLRGGTCPMPRGRTVALAPSLSGLGPATAAASR